MLRTSYWRVVNRIKDRLYRLFVGSVKILEVITWRAGFYETHGSVRRYEILCTRERMIAVDQCALASDEPAGYLVIKNLHIIHMYRDSNSDKSG